MFKITGEQFAEAMVGRRFTVRSASYLYGNQAAFDVRLQCLRVTPNVLDCMRDADTTDQTLRSLTILVVPLTKPLSMPAYFDCDPVLRNWRGNDLGYV